VRWLQGDGTAPLLLHRIAAGLAEGQLEGTRRGRIEDRERKVGCRSRKARRRSGKFGFRGIEGQRTERVRKVDSLTRYSIISRLRAALELGLSRPGSREAAIVLE
jgi:hypothetical protein